MNKPSPEMIKEWTKRLKDSGFKDIEHGNYVTRLPAVSLNSIHAEQLTESLYDTDTADYWRKVGRAAAELPMDHSLYVVVNAFADSGSFSEAAREAGVTYNTAAYHIRKWLSSIGLNSTPAGSRKYHRRKV